jgi:hypothetical protein
MTRTLLASRSSYQPPANCPQRKLLNEQHQRFNTNGIEKSAQDPDFAITSHDEFRSLRHCGRVLAAEETAQRGNEAMTSTK